MVINYTFSLIIVINCYKMYNRIYLMEKNDYPKEFTSYHKQYKQYTNNIRQC